MEPDSPQSRAVVIASEQQIDLAADHTCSGGNALEADVAACHPIWRVGDSVC